MIPSSARVKPAAVAGMFYPGDPGALTDLVDRCMAAAPRFAMAPKALIAPHAGHVFSGPIAATAYATLAARRGEIRRVILLGPVHRVPIRSMALSSADGFATPLGVVPVDWEAQRKLLTLPGVEVADAAFAREHSLEVHLPFLQRVLGEFSLVPVLVGAAKAEDVSRLLRTLWGGPETAVIISSDLSHYHDYATASTKDWAAAEAIELLRADKIADDQACGRYAIYGLLDLARRLDLRATTLDLRNSGDTAGDKERVVGYGSFGFEYAQTARLDDESRARLVEVAKYAVQFGLQHGREPRIGASNLPPALRAQRASFVTLTIEGNLRGCIGSLQPHRALLHDVLSNAYKAAFGDPRFPALRPDELARLHVDISVLSTTRPIEASSEAELLTALRPDMDGLMIREGKKGALFLPHVWGAIPHPELFLKHLKVKAGLKPDHWSREFKAWRFGAESFGETKTATAA